MTDITTANQIQIGDTVYGSDGEKLGTVAEVQPTYLVVEKGFFFPTDYYIPFGAVNSVAAGEVYLNVAKDVALNSGWDTIPDAAVAESMATGQAYAGAGPEVAAYEATSEDELVIPVREEELSATVRPTEAGAVRVEKRVVAEDRVLDVPVTEEQVRVERRIVDRPAGAGDVDAFEEIVVEVPLTAEQVELQKQARVTEEIVVSKEAVQHTEQVRGTVRREEVDVVEDAIDPRLIEGTGTSADRPL
jgi:uncharacterized protein (TIGR02271 family)